MAKTDYDVYIGLEIHAELKTETKMFCNSKNDPDEIRPNVNICPVCMGHPGTLPVINKEAVRHVLKTGIAVQGKLADFTEFDRKNYFYPDIPKGYQISQYKYPLVKGGHLNGVKLTRIHLEEDTALSKHKKNYSLIDFNRAGVPLMELVTEPIIKSSQQASAFAREFQLLIRYLGIAEANMEKGEMRIEANISVSKDGKLGTKTEVKNLNSFKIVEKAIEYEIQRQIDLLEKGEKIVQETRGWDENKAETFSQRSKEESQDYRYFPDPDLPKLKISEVPEFGEISLAGEIGELPWEKRATYKSYHAKAEDVETLVRNPILGDLFERVVKTGADGKITANYITSDLVGLMGSENKNLKFEFRIQDFARLMKMLGRGEIGSRGAKDILAIMYEKGGDPRGIAKKRGLFQESGEKELLIIVEGIIRKNEKVVKDFRAGKESALQFLIGQAMKETKGSANPEILTKLFKETI